MPRKGNNMKKEMTLQQLIETCEKEGYQKVINLLEAMHKVLEQRQAFLFSGDSEEAHQASLMSPMLCKQDVTIIRLRHIAKEKGIILKENKP